MSHALFKYNDKWRFGEFVTPESEPRFGVRLPAVVLPGYFGIRFHDLVHNINDLKIIDADVDENGTPRIDGTLRSSTRVVPFEGVAPEPGNTYLLWHDGTWYFEIMDEFHPKTFKVEGISALRISGPDLRKEFERLDAQTSSD